MPFTDYFGKTIKDGDRIVYAVSNQNCGALAETNIVELVALVPHRDGTNTLMRADHSTKAQVTPYSMGKWHPSPGYTSTDPDKQYVLKVRDDPSQHQIDQGITPRMRTLFNPNAVVLKEAAVG